MTKEEEKEKMIQKIILNTYINLENITPEFLIEFDVINKISILNINCKGWTQQIENNFKRIYQTEDDIKYDAYVINKERTLCYGLIGEDHHFKNWFELQKQYNKITFDLIDKLIEYKNDKLTIQEIAEYIKIMK